MRNFWLGVMMLGLAVILAGCSTPQPTQSRVNLFDASDYRMTVTGDVVAGYVTKTNGIWLSKPAIERLQRERILP